MPETKTETPSLVVAALGTTVRVNWLSGGTDEMLEAARRAWSRCLVEVDDPDVELTAAVRGDLSQAEEDEVNAVGVDSTETLEVVTAGVTVLGIQELAGERLMLHACAVADADSGRAVVFVGPSGAGKTTMAATLGRRWAYVTDETVAVDESDRAFAYPKPLSVVEGDQKVQHSPDDLGLGVAPEEVAITKVLLLDRQPGCTEAGLEPVATADAVALLAEHTSYLTELEQPLHWIAGLVGRTGGLDRVSYSEASQLEPVVASILGSGR